MSRIQSRKNGDVTEVRTTASLAALRKAFGATADGELGDDFVNALMTQLGNASARDGNVVDADFNFMVAVIVGLKPRDQMETMLAAQMAAVHMAMMTFTRRLANTQYIEQQDSASNAFNKLARTYAAQMETLKRYRSSGEQRVIVERVNVAPGGQAIVGNVTHGAPANDGGQASQTTPPALSAPIETPLPSVAGGGEPQKKARLIS
jgi:hypothetical protein